MPKIRPSINLLSIPPLNQVKFPQKPFLKSYREKKMQPSFSFTKNNSFGEEKVQKLLEEEFPEYKMFE
jgi:hypothetical protein